jgi:hypothetical protein
MVGLISIVPNLGTFISISQDSPSTASDMTSVGEEYGKSVTGRDTSDISDENGSKCCPTCASRFLDRMSNLTRDYFEPLRPTGLYIGDLRHIDKNSACPLCRFFYMMRFKDSDSNDYHLMAWLPLQLLTPDNSSLYPNVSGLPGSFLFGVTAGEDPLMSGQQAIQQSKIAGFIAMESSELRNKVRSKWIDHFIYRDEPFHARRVDPSNLDYSLLRHWVQSSAECETSWSSVLDEEALRRELQAAPIYVVDCITRSIVAWTGGDEFVALSYVWGSPDVNRVKIAQPFPCPLPRLCPLVIEDSITVVQKLGLRYLWVDQYCICQWDTILKQAQISRMDAIYKWAKFTIVAAAGQDSGYGLPGVSSRPRLQQPSINVGDHPLLATFPDPSTTLQNSKWSTRAWTYQERFFSKLCMVFTDYQVFYECQDHGGYQCESTSTALVYRQSPMRLSGQLIFPEAKFTKHNIGINGQFEVRPLTSGSKPAVMTSLEDHITRYTCRDLTYDSDALNAISAILREFKLRGIEFLFGIPLSLHSNKPGHQRIVCDDYLLAYGLCWTHGPGPHNIVPRRRKGFPSWSWAGWTGGVTWFPQASDEFQPSTSEILELNSGTDAGELSPLSGPQKSPEMADKRGKLLHVKAIVVPLQLE